MIKKKRKNILKEFGIGQLKPEQKQIINLIRDHKNVLAILPTGFGKSICFQKPAFIFKGLTVVFSPLIALMEDQVLKLKSKEFLADRINSSMTDKERKETLLRINSGKTKILYITPESLKGSAFMKILTIQEIDFVVIDEAHCMDEWGTDFRPAYLKISSFVKNVRPKSILACSATIDKYGAKTLRKHFNFHETIRIPMTRPNLRYSVVSIGVPLWKEINSFFPSLKSLMDNIKFPAIIFAGTIKNVKAIYESFKRKYKTELYYGAIDNKLERSLNFISGKADLMVCTNAWGMGVDKPDIRTVIHYGNPISISQYAQEAGRGGRDGKPTDCILVTDDGSTAEFFMMCKNPLPQKIKTVFDMLLEHSKAEGSKTILIRQKSFITDDISSYHLPAIFAIMEKYGNIEKKPHVSQDFQNIVKIKEPDDIKFKSLYNMLNINNKLEDYISEEYETMKDLRNALIKMKAKKYINYKLAKSFTGTLVTIKKTELYLNLEQMERKFERDKYRYDYMIKYQEVKNKAKYIEDYFKEI